jgi:hypothetical protein
MPPSGIIAKPEGQLFFSARFSVDTFFFLSGFLVGELLLMLRYYQRQYGNGATMYFRKTRALYSRIVLSMTTEGSLCSTDHAHSLQLGSMQHKACLCVLIRSLISNTAAATAHLLHNTDALLLYIHTYTQCTSC